MALVQQHVLVGINWLAWIVQLPEQPALWHVHGWYAHHSQPNEKHTPHTLCLLVPRLFPNNWQKGL
jgi:hypothetical protein